MRRRKERKDIQGWCTRRADVTIVEASITKRHHIAQDYLSRANMLDLHFHRCILGKGILL